MAPFEKGILFIVIAMILSVLLDLWTRVREKKKQQGDTPERYTLPQKTGEYRLQEVQYNGDTYMCLQTQWEKWRIDEGFNGERVVYWRWSTIPEIKDWHSKNYGRK